MVLGAWCSLGVGCLVCLVVVARLLHGLLELFSGRVSCSILSHLLGFADGAAGQVLGLVQGVLDLGLVLEDEGLDEKVVEELGSV